MVKTLEKTFLFFGLSKEEVEKILLETSPTELQFLRGELIYSPEFTERKVGFVIEGRCEVRHQKNGSACAVLNVLNEGDSFGILTVLSENEFPTQIYATKNSRILFFTRDQILKIVNNNSQIAMNLINFLANRIVFLNEKIATFSGTRVEDRLASHLIFEYKKCSSLTFPFNCKKCSEAINAGRASVYRALASLEADNLISMVDKKINIIDLKGLERIAK